VPPEKKGISVTPEFSGIQHSAPPETITVNKYHLELRLTNMRRVRKVGFSWWLTPAGIGLAILLAMLTADFKDALGIPKSTWQAFAIGVLIVAIAASAVLLVLWFAGWLDRMFWHPDPTPRQLVEDIMKELATDRDRAQHGQR
jgi:hypothetical protein